MNIGTNFPSYRGYTSVDEPTQKPGTKHPVPSPPKEEFIIK
jgi:hypothetical protein